MRDVCKSFPGVQALESVSLSVMPGEVHVLLGENGAGKSTLMKIAAGVYEKDSGEILFEGSPVHFRRVKDAEALGISIIHQELNLLPYRTGAATSNWEGNRSSSASRATYDRNKRMHEESAALLSSLGVSFAPDDSSRPRYSPNSRCRSRKGSFREDEAPHQHNELLLAHPKNNHLFVIITEHKTGASASSTIPPNGRDQKDRRQDPIPPRRQVTRHVRAEEGNSTSSYSSMVGKKENQHFRRVRTKRVRRS
jgi:energy-coupling factor transporter ATP-binding protein EcfA2